MCLRAGDRVFTGDTLLIGGTGRTDLPTGDPEALYDSLFGRLLKLDPATTVFPAHDYKGASRARSASEIADNPRLQKRDRSAFVAMMRELNLSAPDHMTEALRTNLSGGKTVEQLLAEAAAKVPFMALDELRRRTAARDNLAFGGDFAQVQPLAHFLARLEIGHALGVDVDRFAGARVAPDAGIALARRESAEAAQLDPAALGQLVGDRIEDRADHIFDLTLGEVGKVAAQFLHQLGTDHDGPRVKNSRSPPARDSHCVSACSPKEKGADASMHRALRFS
jgi:hypothetical protein